LIDETERKFYICGDDDDDDDDDYNNNNNNNYELAA
jgi:hypothetical protein